MPLISVILPVLNGGETLLQAVKSIQVQSVRDWELLVVMEYGSEAGMGEMICQAVQGDGRVRLIQNTQRLGLAESLNLGIRQSTGAFIARMDADDYSLPLRFQRQLELLAAHPEVGICGTWQRHVGDGKRLVHRPPADAETLRASLLFTCELCHSTVMMRRKPLLEHDLFYDPQAQAEDYALWTQAIAVTSVANVPEVLGEYRLGGTITRQKMQALEREHGLLSAAAMERTLGLTLTPEQKPLLNAWTNIFCRERDVSRRETMLAAYHQILEWVWEANQVTAFFQDTALAQVLRARWVWAKWDLQHTNARAETLEDVFLPIAFPQARWIAQALGRNPSPRQLVKKIRSKVNGP